MARFTIYSKDSQSKRYSGEPQYHGSYMGVDYVEFRSVSSPVLIPWEIGDYIDYSRTGMRYKLYSLPMPKKVGRAGAYGASFEYSNVQFYAATKELEIAPFRDLVTDDNRIHFSTRPEVATYEDVHGIARRTQACMDDLYPNRWRIEVVETDDADLAALLTETKEFSVSNGSCLDALSQIYDLWKNIGWIHTYDPVSDTDIITIGKANVRTSDNTTDALAYGLGKGLTSIKKAAANSEEFATRLYVYGSDRNIQTRYYNGLDILNKDSVDIRNLMIPLEKWGKTDGLPDARKAYLQADDEIVEKYGLIPKTIYFDGSEHEEIYPSIIGLTESKVRAAMIESGNGGSSLLPPDTDERIDKVLGCSQPYDNGDKDSVEATPTFLLAIRQLGFDLHEQGKLTDAGHAVISMKSGDCAGREFVVKSFDGSSRYPNIVLERFWDDSLGMGFPNGIYRIEPEDEFVLLDIPMPDYYIKLAQDRLYEAAERLLADYTRVSAFYEPGIDPIRVSVAGKILRAGMYMQVYDEDIVDTEDKKDYVLIDTITIDEKSNPALYSVTLREQKRSVRTFGSLESMIDDAKESAKVGLKRERMYTDRRFRSSEETLAMLKSAFTNFSEGINPVTVNTIALLVGDESLQFKFTKALTNLTDVECPLTYDNTTKQLAASSISYIKHMTLGVSAVSSSRVASEFKGWRIPTYSEVLEDTEARYVYIKASKSSTTGAFVMSKTAIGMEDVSGYYHFLVGVLNSEYNGMRDFVTLYGFTEVLPGQITTDILRSANGNLVIDLANAVISAQNGAKVEGALVIGSGSSGLTNLSEWSGKQEEIDDAKSAADAANAATKTLEAEIGDVKSGLTESVAEINARLDGVVENYFEEGAPALDKKPVTDWIAASDDDDYELINHVGDTYTNIEEYVDDATTPDAGKSWRWCWCDDSSITDKIEVTDKEGVTRYLHWHPIADSDAVKALLEASKAKTAADRKSKTFIIVPEPPYSEGDLWVQGSTGDILRCKKARGENEGFYALDWELASKYTDDTKANEAMDEAASAKEVAETAKAATDALDNDGLFTVAEKRSIRKALKDINPSINSATIPIEWSVTSMETIEGNAWTEITDKSDRDYGWYVSDMHEANGFTIVKINFRVNVKSDVDVYIKSRAEGNYDYTLLSKLDITLNQSDTYQTTARVADTTRGSQNIERKYTFTDVAVGNHFVTVMYRKDSSSDTQPDNGYFKVETYKFAEGSLGDWMSIVQEKGLDIVICDPAVDAADELFSYLDNTGNVWENVSDEVPEGFRDEVYRLFAAYYKEVSAILVDTATSDLDYLSDAMKQGHTIVDNGLVMTSLVAVGDTENPSTANVGAFMNGSDFAEDTEHGKLMHALGIPLTTEDGDEDLEARSKEAKTRMYEDGTIKSTSLELQDGCKIGDVVIKDGQIYVETSQNGSILLSKTGLIARQKDGSFTELGTCGSQAISIIGKNAPGQCYLNEDTYRIAAQINAEDGYHAIHCLSGVFAGLRPATKVINSAGTSASPNTLTALDFSVLVNVASGTCYIQLPTSPLDGQEYVIESKVAMKITASQNIYQFYSGTTVSQVTTSGKQVLRFKYYASANQWTCIIMA